MEPTPTTIVSQLDDTLNALLRAALPGIVVRPIPRGAPPPLEADVQILFAAFFAGSPDERERSRPAGWPFGLRWVQLISAGIDAYPRWLFEVPLVSSARGTAAEPIAEYVLAALLSVAKRLPEIWVTEAKAWRHVPLAMLRGSTLGLVGFGAIAQAVAEKALALGMRVQAVRRAPGPLPTAGVARADSLEALFATSDHVVLAAPATPETRHLVGARVLAQAKPGLHLVNIGRGGLIDQDALLAALDAGRIGAATLDVTEPEPLPDGHPLYRHPRVRISPHTSAISPYTAQALTTKFVRNLERFRRGEPLEDVVTLDGA